MNDTYLDAGSAFALGEDFAYYGMLPPDGSLTPDFHAGYASGFKRFPRRHHADRFVRKWLQLRVGAWRRNRVFSPEVTPQFLEQIDRPKCPVSGVTLTHGTGQETDWSVDRLHNDGAYAPGNLAVLSTRVNRLKGARGLQELGALLARPECDGDLSHMELQRLIAIMGFMLPHPEALPCLLREAEYAPLTPLHPSSVMQRLVWESLTRPAAQRNEFWFILGQDASPEAVAAQRALRLAVTERFLALQRQVPEPYDLFHDGVVHDAFEAVWRGLHEQALHANIAELLDYFPPGNACEMEQPWSKTVSLETAGYR